MSTYSLHSFLVDSTSIHPQVKNLDISSPIASMSSVKLTSFDKQKYSLLTVYLSHIVSKVSSLMPTTFDDHSFYISSAATILSTWLYSISPILLIIYVSFIGFVCFSSIGNGNLPLGK